MLPCALLCSLSRRLCTHCGSPTHLQKSFVAALEALNIRGRHLAGQVRVFTIGFLVEGAAPDQYDAVWYESTQETCGAAAAPGPCPTVGREIG